MPLFADRLQGPPLGAIGNQRAARWKAIGARLAAQALLGETAGLSFVADDMSASVKGHTTNYDGDANGLFTYSSPSTKYVFNSAGLLVPGTTLRCDYDPVTLLPKGLLIEEQRTNLLTRASEFGDAAYTKTRSSVTDNALAAPDGTTTADKLVEDNTAANSHTLTRIVANPLAAGTYTFSIFAKKGERKNLIVRLIEDPTSTARAHRANFNLNTGAIVATDNSNSPTSTNQTITDVGNGWYRLTVTQGNASGSRFDVQMYLWDDDTLPGNPTYSGNGASGIYLWGAQCELGTFPTSYISTAGSTVTRAADNISLAVSALPYSATSGSLYAEGRWYGVGGLAVFICFDEGATNERVILYANNTAASVQLTVVDGGVTQADLNGLGTQAAGALVKAAAAWAANDFAARSTGGNGLVTDASGSLPTPTTLRLGRVLGSNLLNGHLRSVKYLPRRISNAEIQALVS